MHVRGLEHYVAIQQEFMLAIILSNDYVDTVVTDASWPFSAFHVFSFPSKTSPVICRQ